MSYKEVKGNLFNTKAQALVNTVNCVGVMGKGIALEFKRRYPTMFNEYQYKCKKGELRPGTIYTYSNNNVLILNFVIKDDWKQPSRVQWIESCLNEFITLYKNREIKSVAFPWIGAMNGGIPLNIIKDTMRRYLSKLTDVEIEVYDFDPNATDPLFENLKNIAKMKSLDTKRCQKCLVYNDAK